MNKIILMSVMLLAIFSMPMLSMAEEESAMKVDHYEGQEFKTTKDAMAALTQTSAKMAELASAKDLDIAKMEKIHETSYTTESAVALLGKQKGADVKNLAEQLENVHLSSEEHEADNVRRYFIAYQAALNDYMMEAK